MIDKSSYEEVQVSAFSELVKSGVYSENYDHHPNARDFFRSVMSGILAQQVEERGPELRIIDCGCGNGVWLDYLVSLGAAGCGHAIFGFDLTPEMVTLAANRLANKSHTVQVRVGNIIERDSYQFTDEVCEFDVAFTYDVVQQLPTKLQYAACESIIEHIAPGGVAVIFDNDRNSAFGRKMARKKFLTRYLGMKLVPRYYCNAHYPPLADFAAEINMSPELTANVEISPKGVKRALIVQRSS